MILREGAGKGSIERTRKKVNFNAEGAERSKRRRGTFFFDVRKKED